VGTRTSAQVRSHAQKYYNKINKTSKPPSDQQTNRVVEFQPITKPNLDLKSKLTMHTEMVTSIQEALLELNQSLDNPLRDIKLRHSEELLNIIAEEAKETLAMAKIVPELHELSKNLMERIKAVNGTLSELCPYLKNKNSFKYLAERMYCRC